MFYRINGCNMIIYVKSMILLLLLLLQTSLTLLMLSWCLLLCIENIRCTLLISFSSTSLLCQGSCGCWRAKGEGLTWNATLLASISVSILFRLSSLFFFSLLLLFFSFFFLFCLRLQHGKIADAWGKFTKPIWPNYKSITKYGPTYSYVHLVLCHNDAKLPRVRFWLDMTRYPSTTLDIQGTWLWSYVICDQSGIIISQLWGTFNILVEKVPFLLHFWIDLFIRYIPILYNIYQSW